MKNGHLEAGGHFSWIALSAGISQTGQSGGIKTIQ